jgi:hypothetical protein
MISYLAELSPIGLALVAVILTALYAYAYARYVVKEKQHETNKIFFKTLAAGLAAAGTLAVLARPAQQQSMAVTADPFFAPIA